MLLLFNGSPAGRQVLCQEAIAERVDKTFQSGPDIAKVMPEVVPCVLGRANDLGPDVQGDALRCVAC